jgi:hypothetical protein
MLQGCHAVLLYDNMVYLMYICMLKQLLENNVNQSETESDYCWYFTAAILFNNTKCFKHG